MALSCVGYFQKPSHRWSLTCMLWNNKHDSECANVFVERFRNTMTPERRRSRKYLQAAIVLTSRRKKNAVLPSTKETQPRTSTILRRNNIFVNTNI